MDVLPPELWIHILEFGETVPRVARRLCQLIVIPLATSVPSERAFFTLNLILTKLQNRLTNDKVNKLQFIYINQRILRKHRYVDFSKEEL